VGRRGPWRSFAQAAEAFTFFPGVTVSAAMVRRLPEGAGAAYETVPTAAVEPRERELPAAPPGPRGPLRRGDGAMGPLQPGAWAAVKPLALGMVSAPIQERGEGVVHTEELSYVSRVTEAETCGRLALVDTPRRGTATAKTVGAVSDGAEWMQGVVDRHRPDAGRILDFPQAFGAVAHAGQAGYGEGTAACTRGVALQRQTLPSGQPPVVWEALRQLAAVAKRRRALAARPTIQERRPDLERRRGMLAEAWDQARGEPMGSGRVERANNLGGERRLKGTGRPWARAQGLPLVALRTIACRARWSEAWPQITQHLRHPRWHGRVLRQTHRRPSPPPGPLTALSPARPIPLPTPAVPAPLAVPLPPLPLPPPRPAVPKPRPRPPPDHPWRRFRVGRARPHSPAAACGAKL
jgi:hypothetical protein